LYVKRKQPKNICKKLNQKYKNKHFSININKAQIFRAKPVPALADKEKAGTVHTVS